MRVAFISTVQGHQWPGSEYLWSECAGRLQAAKHELFAVVSRDCRGAKTLDALVAGGMVPQYSEPQSGRWSRARARFVNPFQALIRFAPRLMIVSSGSAFDPVYQPALGRFLSETQIPFVFICHFNAETFWVDDGMRPVMAGIFNKAVATVFVCDENRRLTERQLAVKIPRAHVIPPPLRIDLAQSLPWPDQSKDTTWKMACVARLESRWKGQDALFEVLADTKWKQRDYTLSLYGQGSEEQYLKQLAKFYDLEKQIHFAGFADPKSIWATHHLQVLPTRGEGGPMVTMEGMMCGRISVTTACGHHPEYIVDGKTGFLAPFATTQCFGEKMEEAWNRRDEWRQLGVNAHAAIRDQMHCFAAADKFMALLKDIMSKEP